MGKELEKILVYIILLWLFIWLFLEITKAGIRGKDVTINRCGNCNMILRHNQNPCPNCGYTMIWE